MDVPAQNVATLTGLRVLIVEDEPLLALCLGEVIEAEGCIVVGSAGTVATALALVATATFDVAVLDLNLHGQPVDEVASAILRGGRTVVFATGAGKAGVPAKFQGLPVLCKPYSDEAVVAALAGVVASRRFSTEALAHRSEPAITGQLFDVEQASRHPKRT